MSECGDRGRRDEPTTTTTSIPEATPPKRIQLKLTMESTSHHVATYPAIDQYDRWQSHADSMCMSMSEFVECMVEAGLKNIRPTTTPDETNHELREQRNELKHELDRARERIQRLEESLYHGERAAILEHVAQNSGTTYPEVTQHLITKVPEHARRHLDDLEGSKLRIRDGRYYLDSEGDDY